MKPEFLVLAGFVLLGGGCSLVVGKGGEPWESAALMLSTESPRHGDQVTATATGGGGPNVGELSYRFEWFLDGSLQRTEVARQSDTLSADLTKGEQWLVRTTPLTETDEGEPVEMSFTVQNSPPTAASVALSTYQPVTDDVVRARIVGFEDPDGDANASKFRWTIGAREPIETAAAELDLSTLSPPANADTEQLTVQVVPSDAEEDNEASAITLGPFELLENVTRWRSVLPSQALSNDVVGGLVAWDPFHRRFVFRGERQSLWEYTEGFGFALLPTRAPFGSAQTVYDSTPGSERLVFVSFEADQLGVQALDVSQRGSTQLVQSQVIPGGPGWLCSPSLYFDAPSQLLLIYGGWVDECGTGTPSNEIYFADLSVNAQKWVEGPALQGPLPVAGATVVEHPTLDNELLVFGGYTDAEGTPAPILRISYDFSDRERPTLQFAEAGNPLLGRPWGVLAITDREQGVIIGGLGGDRNFEAVENVWVYDPNALGGASTAYPPTGIFDEFDTALGAIGGIAGWDGDRVLFLPGATKDGNPLYPFRLDFRVGEIELQPDSAPEWRSLLRVGHEYPASLVQVANDAAHVVALTSDERGPVFRFDENGWTPVEVPSPMPELRTGMFGGQAMPAGLWSFGGRLPYAPWVGEMIPWRLSNAAWEQWPVDPETLPYPGVYQFIFDAGCGEEAPVGFYGLSNGKGTWLLQCPSEAPACGWEAIETTTVPVGGSSSLGLIAADGNGKLVRVEKESGGSLEVSTMNICDAPEEGWQVASATPDPEHGIPLSASFIGKSMTRISGSPTPEFLIVAGVLNDVWLLRAIADNAYEWRRAFEGTFSTLGAGSPRVVWDEANRRLLSFGTNGSVWELRYRP